jgi:hypothetical protein
VVSKARRNLVVTIRNERPCVREKKGPGFVSSGHPQGDGDMADGFPLNVVVGRLLPTEVSTAVKWMVVRSNAFDRSCLVVYTSWPTCMHTMMTMIAGYML